MASWFVVPWFLLGSWLLGFLAHLVSWVPWFLLLQKSYEFPWGLAHLAEPHGAWERFAGRLRLGLCFGLGLWWSFSRGWIKSRKLFVKAFLSLGRHGAIKQKDKQARCLRTKCLCECVDVHAYTRKHMYVHAHKRSHVFTCAHMHTDAYVHTHVFTCAHMHTDLYVHAHRHVHTRKRSAADLVFAQQDW